MEKKLVDFGSGLAKAPGHIGLDIIPQADIVINLDDPKLKLPFEDNSIDGARASQFVEHIDNLISFLNEVYRVLKPGAVIEINTPYANTKQSLQDPTHRRQFVEETFAYFAKNSALHKEQDEYGITARFEIVRCERGEFPDQWQLFVCLKK